MEFLHRQYQSYDIYLVALAVMQEQTIFLTEVMLDHDVRRHTENMNELILMYPFQLI